MINKSINQAIKDSLNSTTVKLESLHYFVQELSKMTIYGFWSRDAESYWQGMLSRGSEFDSNFVEDVIDFLLEFNIHLLYNLTEEQYSALVVNGGGGIQVLTREVLANSPSTLPAELTKVSFGNAFTVMNPDQKTASMDRLSSLVFLLRVHILTLNREIESKLNS